MKVLDFNKYINMNAVHKKKGYNLDQTRLKVMKTFRQPLCKWMYSRISTKLYNLLLGVLIFKLSL